VTITTPLLAGSLILTCLLGILLGYLLAGRKQDSRKDKARITELEASLQEYKDQVQQHFSTTASLFQDLGHNYRNLYNYMAQSANELCPEIPDTTALQFDATDLLPEHEPSSTEDTSPAPSSVDDSTDTPHPDQEPTVVTNHPGPVEQSVTTTQDKIPSQTNPDVAVAETDAKSTSTSAPDFLNLNTQTSATATSGSHTLDPNTQDTADNEQKLSQ